MPESNVSTSMMLVGMEQKCDDAAHVGLAIEVSANEKFSTLVIPDVSGVIQGTSPIFIDNPITLEMANLKIFLEAKKVNLPDWLNGVLDKAQVSCQAFYYQNAGGMFMVFQVKVIGGLIASILKGATLTTTETEQIKAIDDAITNNKPMPTGIDSDIALSRLFDVNSVSLKVFKCPSNSDKFKALKDYVALLKTAEEDASKQLPTSSIAPAPAPAP